MEALIKQELQSAQTCLNNFLNTPESLQSIHDAANIMIRTLNEGHKIISCGNGGSHCDAMHFAEELAGKFRETRSALPAIAISDPTFITCAGNDFGYEHIFSRFIEALGQKGDVLLAITTSGNSPNIIEAANAAKEKGMCLIGLTGKDGGTLSEQCDCEIRVPHFGYADRIQEIHIKVIHTLIFLIENQIFSKE